MGLPAIKNFEQGFTSLTGKFSEVLKGIGGNVHEVKDHEEVLQLLQSQFSGVKRIISTVTELPSIAEGTRNYEDAHSLEDVDLAVIPGDSGYSENGVCVGNR